MTRRVHCCSGAENPIRHWYHVPYLGGISVLARLARPDKSLRDKLRIGALDPYRARKTELIVQDPLVM